jgi:Domain of unknown function (DUF4173)
MCLSPCPDFAVRMTSSTTASAQPATRVKVFPIVIAAFTFAWLADFLLWSRRPGANVGIFSIVLVIAMLATRPRESIRGTVRFATVLMLGACVQSGIEFSFTNALVLLVLFAVIGGATYYTSLPRGWPRWVEQCIAFASCATRLPWLASTWLRQRTSARPLNPAEAVSRWMMILLPGMLLLVVFGAILSGGNIVFREFASRFGDDAWHWLVRLDFSWWRLAFWLLSASFALACVRPHEQPIQPRELTTEPSRWVRADAGFARKQSIAALVVVNGLFLVVNTLDVIHLWLHRRIPDGISHYTYIHQGVNNLIVATVLAAVVLVIIFHQQPAVSRSRPLRWLGYVWIVQNLMLAAGVFLRDALYVSHSQMLTEKRIYVGCFLALVVLGYGFLALHIHRGSPLSRLLWRNAVATFILIYVIQFLDVRGFAARCCAEKAERGEWAFDARYWATQGPAAWPAIAAVATGAARPDVRSAAAEQLVKLRSRHVLREAPDWRSWQARHERSVPALQVTAH